MVPHTVTAPAEFGQMDEQLCGMVGLAEAGEAMFIDDAELAR